MTCYNSPLWRVAPATSLDVIHSSPSRQRSSMNADRRNPGWFLKTSGRVEGPISESEMREAMEKSNDPDLMIRQGDSDWHPAEVIRKKLDELAANGIYIRFKQVAEGPFTLNKAYELLQTVGLDGIKVRTGPKGEWVSATKWLRALNRLKRKKKDAAIAAVAQLSQQTTPTAPADATAKPVPVGTNETIEAAVVLEEEVVVEAIVLEDDPIPVAYPVAAVPEPVEALPAFNTAPQITTARPRNRATGRGNSRAAVAPAIVNNASDHGHPLAGIPTHADLSGSSRAGMRPVNPKTQNNTAANGPWGKVAGVTLSAVVLLGIFGIKALRVSGKAALRGQQAERDRMQPGGMFGSTSSTGFAASTGPASPVQYELPGSNGPVSTANVSQPPVVSDGMLFRPTFATSDGVVDAGTAFAAKVNGSSNTFVISALHLFGPAGGLNQDVPASQLPSRWQGLSLQDCKSHIVHEDVAMQPVRLAQAKPLPESSTQGDVAVCRAENTGNLRLKPWTLANRLPATGETG